MAPRSEEQNAAIKDERREQILSAALRVFATRGFAATKISDIVARGGISHGLLYHYFKSKEDIFGELLKMATETASHTLEMVEALPISPIEKVKNTAKYILTAIADFEESAYYFLIVNHASMMEDLNEDMQKYIIQSTALQSMVRILEEGQRAGQVRSDDPEEMTMVFFSAIQGLAANKLAMGDFKMPDPEILVHIVEK